MYQGQNIQVFVRCRPLNSNERRSVVDVIPDRREVKVLDRGTSSPHDTKSFFFDQVFASDAIQSDVYMTVVRPLIDQVLMGFNCTVFAYGQTGTGKTYTMEGRPSEGDYDWEHDPHYGIIPRSISQLFDTLKDQTNEFTVRVSFLELYNEDTYDLLSATDDTSRLKIFDDSQKKGSVIVGGLEEIIVQTKTEIFEILKRGSAKRQTAATLMNACSSRSHTIFSVTVHIRESSMDGEELLKIGKLNLVDLAGSENIRRSGAMDKRAREAGNINQSLLTLGRVITALVEKRPHIPYRESKLTRLLQDSLGGKTKTSIIATISPATPDLEDTLSTLEYASRAKKITNKPEMNQRLTKKALLSELTNEIERLRRDLQATREKNGIYIEEENYKDMCKKLSATDTAVQEKEDRLTAMQVETEKMSKLFEDFTARYEKTREELNKARESCEHQKKLITAHKKQEKVLVSQAERLVKVAETATKDVCLLHSKKERIEGILRDNRASVDKYQPKVREDTNRLESLMDLYSKEVASVRRVLYGKINESVESNQEVIDGVLKHNQKLAMEFKSQAESYRALFDNLLIQSDNLCQQAQHYESLAKECRSQSCNLKNQALSLKSQATDLDHQATSLESGEPIVNRVKGLLSDLQIHTEQDEERLTQLTSTLNSTVRREIHSLRQDIDYFLTRGFKDDVITGLTPQKRTYDIPKRLDRVSLCDSISED